MKRFRARCFRVFAFLALLGFVSVFADVHADEYGARATETCCVTCCPAHHLAPPQAAVVVERVAEAVGHVLPDFSCHSIDPSYFLFRPPRPAASV